MGKKDKKAVPIDPPSEEDDVDDYDDSEDEEVEEESESEQEEESDNDEDEEADGDDDDDDDEDESDVEFEDQGSSSDDDDRLLEQAEESDDEEEVGGISAIEDDGPRHWTKKSKELTISREHELAKMEKDGSAAVAALLHVDDLSSDDEEAGNTIGKVPLRWYEDYEHIGYDLQGKRIGKSQHKDGLTSAIEDHDDNTSRRTVYDAYNDKEVVLSERELEIIRRIQSGAYAHPEHDAHPDYIPYYTADEHVLPLSDHDPFKRRFTPSKWEMMKITKIIKGLKDGSILPRAEALKLKKEAKEAEKAPTLLWSVADDDLDDLNARKGPMYIAAPKIALPGHAESYRPPDEYLLNAEEEALWLATPEEDREMNFLPKKHDNLRSVGAYESILKERFERCLDLYLCPRSFKRRLQIDPESLVPKLPNPKDLKPFPNELVTKFENGHNNTIRGLSTSPDGQYLVSGDDDGKVCLWEVSTGRLLQSWHLSENFNSESPISFISWNPSRLHHIVAIAAGCYIYLIATGTGGAEGSEITEALLYEATSSPSGPPSVQTNSSSSIGVVNWSPMSNNKNTKKSEKKEKKNKKSAAAEDEDGKTTSNKNRFGVEVGVRAMLTFEGTVTHLCWHRKGDYFATAAPSAPSGNVIVHQLSKRSSQVVIKKRVNKVGGLCFHPSQPIFFVATQQHVRVYHLVKQRMVKKLMSGCKAISSIDVHSSGDHVILGSYDRRVVWFDMDRGSMPYKTLKYHTKAIRNVLFHKHYPLFATCSDDNTVHIFHATVYSDLMKDPFIVPLKVLTSPTSTSSNPSNQHGIGVSSICFHPNQPWLFSAEKDNSITLYHDV